MNLPPAPRPQIGMMLHLQPCTGEALPEFFALRAALLTALEEIGVQAVWVTEHHFDPQSLSAQPLLLLAHWAARTARIQLGVAAVLAAGRNPLRLAEEIALLSQLAPGRIAIGFAKGGPFEAQKQAFGWGSDAARDGMRAVVDAVLGYLDGGCAAAASGALPWPVQPPLRRPLPLFVASRDAETLRWAARRGLGWMSAQFWPAQTYDEQARVWAETATGRADALLVRGLWIDDDDEAARAHALRWVADFRQGKQSQWRAGFRGPLADAQPEDVLARLIVGDPTQCARQLAALLVGRQVPRLAFNPLHAEPRQQLRQMQRLLHEVWPLACSDEAAAAAVNSAGAGR